MAPAMIATDSPEPCHWVHELDLGAPLLHHDETGIRAALVAGASRSALRGVPDGAVELALVADVRERDVRPVSRVKLERDDLAQR